MKRVWGLLVLALCMTAGAHAQTDMRVFVSDEAMDGGTAVRLIAFLQSTFPQEKWTLEMEDEETLYELVMADCSPQLVICSPGEARVWAEEGLLLPMQSRIGGQRRIQRQVLDACIWDEQLFMAPLQAEHRQIAVNAKLFEQRHLGYMLDQAEYPAWYPTQFQQIVEEFVLSDMTALAIWPPKADDAAALEAMVQAIYGGSLVSEEGDAFQMDTPEIRAGVQWLQDLLQSEMIVMAQSREEALERFVCGETAMFIDWTADEAQRQRNALEENGVEVVTMPYPSTLGVPVRSYEIVGICAFASGNEQMDALALETAALLHEHAQTLMGSRSIFRDEGVWLACLSGTQRGATLRSLFSGALESVLGGRQTPKEVLSLAQAALDAMQ